MNKKQLKDIVALGEGFTTEFKRAGTSNFGREICAFANATGGVILIGVTDSGEIIGVANYKEKNAPVMRVDLRQMSSQVCLKSVPSDLADAILRASVLPVDLIALMASAGQTNRTRFRNTVLRPLIDASLLEMTIPDKPQSSKQRYRLTELGRRVLRLREGETS